MDNVMRLLDDKEEEAVAATPWSGIWVTACVSAAQGLLFYALFLWKRKKQAAVNDLDLYETRQHKFQHRSPTPFAQEKWWKAAWSCSDEELLRCVGLDTFQYLRLLWMGVRLCFVGTLLSLILIPIYATGSIEEAQEFNQLTLARVEKSWRLYVAVVCWYIFVAYALFLFWHEWALYRTNRSQYLAVGDPDMPKTARYAAVAEQVDKSTNLLEYFERLFPKAAAWEPAA